MVSVKPDNVSEHLNEFTDNLGSLSQSPDFGDVTFHFGHGVKIKTNKLLMAKSSKLFWQLFELNCGCASWLSIQYDVVCPDVSPEAVKVLLDLLHLGSARVNSSDPDILDQVVQAAELFQLTALREGFGVIRSSGQKCSAASTSAEDEDLESVHLVSPPPVQASFMGVPSPELEIDDDHDKGKPVELNEAIQTFTEADGSPTSEDVDQNKKRKHSDELCSSSKRPRTNGVEAPEINFSATIIHHDVIKTEPLDFLEEVSFRSEEENKVFPTSADSKPVRRVHRRKVCHVCAKRFETLLELAKHFQCSHRNNNLAFSSGTLSANVDSAETSLAKPRQDQVKREQVECEPRLPSPAVVGPIVTVKASNGKKTIFLLTWQPDTQVAEPCDDGHLFSSHNMTSLIKDSRFNKFLNPPNRKVLEPRDGDLYFFEGVTEEILSSVIRMDGLRWRNKGNKVTGGLIIKYFPSETGVPEVYHTKFKKRVCLDTTTNKMLVQYVGDHRYAARHLEFLQNVPKDQWPPEGRAIHPDEVCAGFKKKRYEEFYRSLPDHLKGPFE